MSTARFAGSRNGGSPREQAGPGTQRLTAYLQTWTDGAQAALKRQGEVLEYAASNQYPRIGLARGDFLYIGFLEDGYLHLIGRMRVAEIIDRATALKRRGSETWDSEWFAVADPKQSGRVLRSRDVPLTIVRRLEFERATGARTRLHPDPTGRLDGKALQAIRRLTPESAELLGNLL